MAAAARIAAVLSPHLGANSAESVAQHVCAKYGIEVGLQADKAAELREFLRRGLVAFVGASAAADLAERCVREIGAAEAP
jgi:hypothetical protein